MSLGVSRIKFEGFHQLALSLRRLMFENIKSAQGKMWPRITGRHLSRLLIVAFGFGQASILHRVITRGQIITGPSAMTSRTQESGYHEQEQITRRAIIEAGSFAM